MMTPPVDPDTGVQSVILTSINARLTELKADVRDVKQHVDDKLSELSETYVNKDFFNLTVQMLDKRIADLENERKKYISLIISAVVVAVLALVIKSGTISLN